MVLGGLGCWFTPKLDRRAFLATASAVWVVLEGLGGRWVVMLDRRLVLA